MAGGETVHETFEGDHPDTTAVSVSGYRPRAASDLGRGDLVEVATVKDA